MAHPSYCLFLAAMLLGCGGAPRATSSPSARSSREQDPAKDPDRAHAPADTSATEGSAAIAAAVRGAHRSPGAAERDQYRHPVETLSFFGLASNMTVLDIGPGAGYYTEILAPVLAKDGLYIATNREPPSTAPTPSGHHWTAYEGVRFDELLRAGPELYGRVQVIRVDYEKPRLNLDAKVDLVLLMREVHMMKNWGTLDTWLREIHRALKPNGVLGVEEHRASPGTNAEDVVRTGYLPEAWVIEKIEAAGFALAGKSEINANARDTKDYPNGVWSLAPSFQAGSDSSPASAHDRANYAPIGESDRMTLKFVRVAERGALNGRYVNHPGRLRAHLPSHRHAHSLRRRVRREEPSRSRGREGYRPKI